MIMDWIGGSLTTTILGFLAFGGAGAAIWFNLPTYLPFVGRGVVWGLVILGSILVSYGQGYASATKDARDRQLVDQARNLQETIDQLNQSMAQANALQNSTRDFVAQAQADAAARKGETDDLLTKLAAVPVALNCGWSPSERSRLRDIHITPEKPRRANPATGQLRSVSVR